MTALEMKFEFVDLLDRVSSFNAPGYEDDEISFFLTKGQERLVVDKYLQKGNKYLEGFENTEKRRKDLGELTKNAEITNLSSNQTGTLPNGAFFDLPLDFLWAIKEETTIAYINCNNESLIYEDTDGDGVIDRIEPVTTRIKVVPITHDKYTSNIKNPFKKPFVDDDDGLVWRLDIGKNISGIGAKRHELITDGNNIAIYHLRYLKKPIPIIISDLSTTSRGSINGYVGPLNCTLDESVHREIIDFAVAIAAGVTQPEEYKIKQIEKQESE